MNKKILISILVVSLLALGFRFFLWPALQQDIQASDVVSVKDDLNLSPAMVTVILPESLSAKALQGKNFYSQACLACHGVNAAGQAGVAPPLIHKIYEPSHHSDISFYRAAQSGVRSHHWGFGDMPPVSDIDSQKMSAVIRYIRELQRANGIH